METKCVSIGEAAASLGVSARSVSNWIRRGELEAIKLGRRTVIRTNELDRWLAGRPARTANGGR
jgi:excisionase family DNA binding protein